MGADLSFIVCRFLMSCAVFESAQQCKALPLRVLRFAIETIHWMLSSCVDTGHTSLDLSRLPRGIYFVRMDGSSIVKKLVLGAIEN